MKKLMGILVAAMVVAMSLGFSSSVSAEEAEKEKEIVATVKKSVDERTSDLELKVSAHKAEIKKLERQLGVVGDEARLTAAARAEIYRRLEVEHARAAMGIVAIKALTESRDSAAKIAARLTRQARGARRDIVQIRKDLNVLVVRVKDLGALDAAKAQEIGKLLGRVVATEEVVKGHELTLKTQGARLDGHDSVLERLRDDTGRLKGMTDTVVVGLSQVAKRALRSELSLDFGPTTGLVEGGWTTGFSARLQGGESPFGLLLGVSLEAAKAGDSMHLSAAYGRLGVTLGGVEQRISGFLAAFAGAASIAELGTTPGFVGGAEIGGLIKVYRFASIGASIGPVFGAFVGWRAGVFVQLDLFTLIQQLNTREILYSGGGGGGSE